MAEQVGVMSRCIKSLDGLAYTQYGRNLKTWCDFEHFLAGNSPEEVGNFAALVAGAGAGCFISSGLATRPGLAQLTTGTTNTGRAAYTFASSSFLFGGGVYTFETDLWVQTLSTVGEEYVLGTGFGNSWAAEYTNGAYFFYDRLNAGNNWRLKTADNGVRTDTDSGVTVLASAWIRLKVVVNATGTLVSYYINGVLVGTNVLTIPTAAGRTVASNIMVIKSAGITPRIFIVDWIWTHLDLAVTL